MELVGIATLRRHCGMVQAYCKACIWK